MESIFLILSGVILAAGILYWFWSHIQLTQKKVQLLENAVFELRGMLGTRGGGGGEAPVAPLAPLAPVLAPSPARRPPSAYPDLGDDDWQEPEGAEGEELQSTSLEDLGVAPQVEEEGSAPIQIVREGYAPAAPGGEEGGLMGGAVEMMGGLTQIPAQETPAAEFRELFLKESGAGAGAGAEASAAEQQQSLESMPVKELRRLAEQRGIAGAADMRKKEILAALRQQVSATTTTVEEKTLDLTVEETPVLE